VPACQRYFNYLPNQTTSEAKGETNGNFSNQVEATGVDGPLGHKRLLSVNCLDCCGSRFASHGCCGKVRARRDLSDLASGRKYNNSWA